MLQPETRRQLDWLKENAPGIWWHVVEDRIGMADEAFSDHVAEAYKSARPAAGPWTETELREAGIPENLWNIAQWWDDLFEMSEDLPRRSEG